MIIAEMRAADVPVKILGFQIKRKRIGEDFVEFCRKLAHRLVGKIGRCIKGRGRLAGCVEGSNLVVHGITLMVEVKTGPAGRAGGLPFNASVTTLVP